MKNKPLVKVTGMWTQTSQRGNKYIQAKVGNVYYMIMKNDHKRDEQDPDWFFYIREAGKVDEEDTMLDDETLEI